MSPQDKLFNSVELELADEYKKTLKNYAIQIATRGTVTTFKKTPVEAKYILKAKPLIIWANETANYRLHYIDARVIITIVTHDNKYILDLYIPEANMGTLADIYKTMPESDSPEMEEFLKYYMRLLFYLQTLVDRELINPTPQPKQKEVPDLVKRSSLTMEDLKEAQKEVEKALKARGDA